MGVEETDRGSEELVVGTEDGGAGLDEPWSSSSSSPLVSLLRSKVNDPASRCCSMCAEGSVEFGGVTPKAQIKSATVLPSLGTSKARIGLVSED